MVAKQGVGFTGCLHGGWLVTRTARDSQGAATAPAGPYSDAAKAAAEGAAARPAPRPAPRGRPSPPPPRTCRCWPLSCGGTEEVRCVAASGGKIPGRLRGEAARCWWNAAKLLRRRLVLVLCYLRGISLGGVLQGASVCKLEYMKIACGPEKTGIRERRVTEGRRFDSDSHPPIRVAPTRRPRRANAIMAGTRSWWHEGGFL